MNDEAFDCAEVDRAVDSYLDGEFGPEERAEMDQHLAVCAACAQLVHRQAAFKAQLRSALPRPQAPARLRRQIGAALDRERTPMPVWRRGALTMAPAAAAAVALVMMYPRQSPLVEDAIARHQRELPIEVSGRADVVGAWLSPKVGFAVRPPRLQNAALVGARLAHLRDHDAAYLIYDVSGARVSMFVFDPRDLPLEAPHRRDAAGRPIYFGADRGYHVALYRDQDVGYAVASDLDEDRMYQLVSSAVTP